MRPTAERGAALLRTLENTVEFFNLVLGAKPSTAEKQNLVTFLPSL